MKLEISASKEDILKLLRDGDSLDTIADAIEGQVTYGTIGRNTPLWWELNPTIITVKAWQPSEYCKTCAHCVDNKCTKGVEGFYNEVIACGYRQ